MHVEQYLLAPSAAWPQAHSATPSDAQLVFAFGGKELVTAPEFIGELRDRHPNAILAGCSTAGEILGEEVHDGCAAITAVRFEHSQVRQADVSFEEGEDSRAVGERLVRGLPQEGLRHVFVLSDGLNVNGTELVRGITGALPATVGVTGGLSGDGGAFESTVVLGTQEPRSRLVSAIGFYGSRLKIGCASLGGWDSFGPERLITQSSGNTLHQLDGRPALELYKKYLGSAANELPGSALLFPLALTVEGSDRPIVRTVLGVDEAQGTMTFAGDMPEGARVQLMRANFDRLVKGATGAAEAVADFMGGAPTELAILISCVGRKMVLKQRVEEEVEAVRGVVGPGASLTGFYSYGEISPFAPTARCELHNQTMTITGFSEAA
jgi:hypothetical protein